MIDGNEFSNGESKGMSQTSGGKHATVGKAVPYRRSKYHFTTSP